MPEAAADDGEAAGLRDANPEQAELRVGASDDDRRPLAQSRLRSGLGGDCTDHRPRLDDLGKHGPVKAADLEHAIRPVAVGELEHARARTERRIRHEDARKPAEDPVSEHPDVGDRGEDVGLVAGDPDEARRGRDGDPVARVIVDLLRGAAAHKLAGLLAGARVDIRARPDLVPPRVVENHSLAHARRADGLDALADQLPVVLRHKDLRARHSGQLRMRVLPLADRHLRPVRCEQHGARTAGAGVDREQQLVAHAATADRLTTLTSGSPAAKRRISSAIISAPCSSVSCVAPPR